MYDPVEQQFEDLILDFSCLPATKGFWYEYGVRMFPDAIDQDAVKFEIERGTGEALVALEPLLLPQDEDSEEYQRLVAGYAERAVALVDEHMDFIIESLSEPYRP
ncbi:MAG TPA: hypothetical protein VG452_01760 [Egibacteraceae bacterium]|nr:hypothetical protein [Actinomycetota bacterium]HWB70915.1 hypothetical protein [Egibacteraceae bacterium]